MSPYLEILPGAALRSLQFAFLGLIGALLLGMTLALMKVSSNVVSRVCAQIYTEAFRNTPLLVVIFIYYYGLTTFHVTLTPLQAGSLALAMFYAAYFSEVFRAAIQAVAPGQREACLAIGMTLRQAYGQVILPQAMRIALPGAGNLVVDLLKSTALMTTIAGAELMSAAQNITSETFQPMKVYLIVGAIYFALCYPLTHLVLWIERHIRSGRRLSPFEARSVARMMSRSMLATEAGLQS